MEKKTYTEAMARLEAIVQQLEDNKLDVDELGKRVKEAQALITFCRDKLYQTDEEIKKLWGKEEK